MRAAIISFDPESLRSLLRLPEDVTIARCEVDYRYHGRLNVVIHGAGWEVFEGQAIVCAQAPDITTVGDEITSIDWHLPE